MMEYQSFPYKINYNQLHIYKLAYEEDSFEGKSRIVEAEVSVKVKALYLSGWLVTISW